MRNANHTPGPWVICPHGDGFEVEQENGKAIAQAFQTCPARTEDSHIERRANARLISAAPELLAFVSEYLEAWANGMAGDSYLRRQAEALLGEATGEQPK